MLTLSLSPQPSKLFNSVLESSSLHLRRSCPRRRRRRRRCRRRKPPAKVGVVTAISFVVVVVAVCGFFAVVCPYFVEGVAVLCAWSPYTCPPVVIPARGRLPLGSALRGDRRALQRPTWHGTGQTSSSASACFVEPLVQSEVRLVGFNVSLRRWSRR